MKHAFGWRLGVIGVVVALGVLVFMPNIAQISWWPTKTKIKYGLDIQGGLYLAMGVDTPGVLRETANRLADTIREAAKTKGIGVI